jgi:hypothetical protein
MFVMDDHALVMVVALYLDLKKLFNLGDALCHRVLEHREHALGF